MSRYIETGRVECATHEEAKEKMRVFESLMPEGEYCVVVGNRLLFVMPKSEITTRYSVGWTDPRSIYGSG